MKKYLSTLLLAAACGGAYAQTGIGTTTPDASSAFQVSSTTKGFLPPVMTTTQRNAISNPAPGLIIFNSTTNQLECNTGSTFTPVWTAASVSNSWGTAGNSGTTAGTNFIGTTDNADLVFKRNGVTAGMLNESGTSTSFGVNASANTSGGRNTSIGYNAGAGISSAGEATGVGYNALYSNTSGYGNTSVGSSSMRSMTTGSYNAAFGQNAMNNTGAGDENVAIGHAAMSNSTGTPANNTAVGSNALTVATGSNNVALGYQAGYAQTSGGSNVAIGYRAGNTLTSGTGNIAIGASQNLASNTGSNQLNIGGAIFGTGLTGSQSAPAGKIGIGTASPQSTLHNAGSTILADSSFSGTASTVTLAASASDNYSGVVINQTTADCDITLSSPTNTTAGRVFKLINASASTKQLTYGSYTIAPGNTLSLTWNGTAWSATPQGNVTRFASFTSSQTLGTTYFGYTCSFDATSGNLSMILPDASGQAGKYIELYRKDNTANSIMFSGTSSQTFNGNTNLWLYSKGDVVVVRSDGSNWIITADNRVNNAATGGGGSVNYLRATKTAAVASLTTGNAIPFESSTVQSSGSAISLASGSTGVFTLKAGNTYHLQGSINYLDGSNISTQAAVQWRDITNNALFGNVGTILNTTISTPAEGSDGTADAIITPTTDITVRLELVQVVQLGNVGNASKGYPWAFIQVLSNSAAASTAAAVNTVDNSYLTSSSNGGTTTVSGNTVFNYTNASGNLPLSGGGITLQAGKKYKLVAQVQAVNADQSWQWGYMNGASVVYIGNYANPVIVTSSNTTSGSQVAEAIFTPTTATTVYLFYVGGGGTNYYAAASFAEVTQLGTSTATMGQSTQTYSPTWTATTTNPTLGSNTSSAAYVYNPFTNSLHISYRLQMTAAGTSGSGDYLFSLPSGYTINTSAAPLTSVGSTAGLPFGQVSLTRSGVAIGYGAVIPGTTNTTLKFTFSNISAPTATMLPLGTNGGFQFNNAEEIFFTADVPVN